MKTQTQRQLQMFRLRVEAIAKALEADVEFPEKGEEQIAGIILGKHRGLKVSHDLFRGQLTARGVWPKRRNNTEVSPSENKTFRIDWTKSDDEIVKGLKDRYIPWYDVEIEVIEAKLGVEMQEQERQIENVTMLADVYGQKIAKKDLLHSNYFEAKTPDDGIVEARVEETQLSEGEKIRITITTNPVEAKEILQGIVMQKEAKK